MNFDDSFYYPFIFCIDYYFSPCWFDENILTGTLSDLP